MTESYSQNGSSHKPLETARDLAVAMPERWGIEPGPRLLGGEGEISALMLDAQPGEVWSHASEAHILSFVSRGECSHRMWHDGKPVYEGVLPHRSVNIVPAGRIPRAVISEPLQVLHVYLPHADLARRAAQGGCRGRPGDLEIVDPLFASDPQLEGLAALLMQSLADEGPPDRLYLDCLAGAIATRVIRRWSSLAGTRPVTSAAPRGGLAPWQVNRLTRHMEDHLADDVSLEDLARILGLSTYHLCRAFKQSTGLPPHRWRLQRRIERAREMLERTDVPVTEIAAAVGYDDPSQLAAAFRKGLGVTPSQYRRERRS